MSSSMYIRRGTQRLHAYAFHIKCNRVKNSLPPLGMNACIPGACSTMLTLMAYGIRCKAPPVMRPPEEKTPEGLKKVWQQVIRIILAIRDSARICNDIVVSQKPVVPDPLAFLTLCGLHVNRRYPFASYYPSTLPHPPPWRCQCQCPPQRR